MVCVKFLKKFLVDIKCHTNTSYYYLPRDSGLEHEMLMSPWVSERQIILILGQWILAAISRGLQLWKVEEARADWQGCCKEKSFSRGKQWLPWFPTGRNSKVNSLKIFHCWCEQGDSSRLLIISPAPEEIAPKLSPVLRKAAGERNLNKQKSENTAIQLTADYGDKYSWFPRAAGKGRCPSEKWNFNNHRGKKHFILRFRDALIKIDPEGMPR